MRLFGRAEGIATSSNRAITASSIYHHRDNPSMGDLVLVA